MKVDFGKPPPGYVPGIGRGATPIISGVTDRTQRADTSGRLAKKDDADKIYDFIDQELSSRAKKRTRGESRREETIAAAVEKAEIAISDWDAFTVAVPLTKKPKTESRLFPVEPSNAREAESVETKKFPISSKTRALLENLVQTTPDDPSAHLALAKATTAASERRRILERARVHCPLSEEVWLASLEEDRSLKDLAVKVLGEKSEKLWLWLLEKGRDGCLEILKQGLCSMPDSEALWKELLRRCPPEQRLEVARSACKHVAAAEFYLVRMEAGEAGVFEEAKGKFEDRDALLQLWLARIDQAVVREEHPRDLGKEAIQSNKLENEEWLAVVAEKFLSGHTATAEVLLLALIDSFEDAEAVEEAASRMHHDQVKDFVLATTLKHSKFHADPEVWFQRCTEYNVSAMKASKIANDAIKACPEDELLRLAAAKLLLRKGLFNQAVELLEAAVRDLSESVDLKLALGKVLLQTEDFKRALQMFDEAPGDESARTLIKRAVAYAAAGKRDAAVKQTKAALTQFPENWKLQCMLMQLTSEIAAKIPNNAHPAVWAVASDIALQKDATQEARSLLERGRAKHPNSELLWVKGVQLELIAGAPDIAKLVLSKALNACPQSGVLWAFSVELEDGKTRFSRCAEAIKKLPENATVLAEAGKFFWREKSDRAIGKKWLENAVNKDPQDGDVLLALLALKKETGEWDEEQVFSLLDCNRGLLWNAFKKKFENQTKRVEVLADAFIAEFYSANP